MEIKKETWRTKNMMKNYATRHMVSGILAYNWLLCDDSDYFLCVLFLSLLLVNFGFGFLFFYAPKYYKW